MAIGQRIRYFRTRIGMTQKQLGEVLGFLGKTSDVRVAQYESEARIPKENLVKEMAHLFHINPKALTVPEIDTYIGLMHTLFALEDMYGLTIGEVEGRPTLTLDYSVVTPCSTLESSLRSWMEQSKKLKNGEISKDEYNEWRYRYPELNTYQYLMKSHSEKKDTKNA